ncbi:hypothetical protein LV779_32585 [Streptomyces thinghirensis]|nr:hypothetical protein [Streptomyces thinghirensis]
MHFQARVREGGGGLAPGVAGRPVTGLVRARVPSLPAGVRRVEDGGVLGGDDAVARVAGVRARVEW